MKTKKLIIEIPEKEYNSITGNIFYIPERRSNTWLTSICLNAIANGTPLSEELEDIRTEIEHLACRQYEHKLMLDREEVLDILNKHIKENKQ